MKGRTKIALDPRIVNGPIVATSSRFDEALSYWFPLASIVGRQLGELEDPIWPDTLIRLRAQLPGTKFDALFDALGGLSKGQPMKVAGVPYVFSPGETLVRVDGDLLITGGRPPGGAHSQIFIEPVAWLIWSAALEGRARPR